MESKPTLTTMYAAAKQAGVSPEAIRRQTMRDQVPEYFVLQAPGKYQVNINHPLWTQYSETMRIKKQIAGPVEIEKQFQDFIAATAAVITRKFGADTAEKIRLEILEELNN